MSLNGVDGEGNQSGHVIEGDEGWNVGRAVEIKCGRTADKVTAGRFPA